MPSSLKSVVLTSAEERVLIELYVPCPLTCDELPFTDEFDALHAEFCVRTGRTLTRWQVWRALINLRKRNALPRKGR
jgi:hypothetical protein